MKILFFILAINLLQLFSGPCFAQANTDTLYRVRTKDGNEYIGKLLSRDTSTLTLKTEKLGEITLMESDIKSLELIDQRRLQNGKYWADNPQATRYFWSPNGYGLKKGEGYYQNVWIFFNQVSVGVTDNISIGAGVAPLFLFGGEPTPVWITPKLSFPVIKNKLNVGAGALIGTIIGDDGEAFGVLYGVSTYGSPDRNVNIGLGWGFGGGEIAKTPTVNFSFMHRTSASWYLLSENYYIDAGNDQLGILSFGARWVPKILGLDFGLAIPIGNTVDTFVGIPWLGVTIAFGKRSKQPPRRL